MRPVVLSKLPAYSIPHLVHIETTYACNGKCLFCYNPYRADKINLNIIDRIVQSVYNSHIPHIYLIGGEPSLLGADKLNEYIETLAERSSVTIVTNGLKCLGDLSKKLACIGVPIHGLESNHERLTQKPGGFKKTLDSIRRYVDRGFDVRCIPVLTSWNYYEIYTVIGLAKKLGMESVFVDRFEDGGLGSANAPALKPSLKQFQEALSQMIAARDDFDIPVGFGTAIPLCLDKRLISENMYADCGVGTTFGAVNPKGDFRLCNQSEVIYGNVLDEPIEKIWRKKEINEFRDLEWVAEPCQSCSMLTQCLCGCKVDNSCSGHYNIDYAVRGLDKPLNPVGLIPKVKLSTEVPAKHRSFYPNRYTKLNIQHKEAYLITRYQTIVLDDVGVKILDSILRGIHQEQALIAEFQKDVEPQEIRAFISQLIDVKALDLI